MKLDEDFNDKADGEQELQLVSVGRTVYGVFKNRISGMVDWAEPAPLPHAPPAVLGVVSVQGRMLTVLDLAAFPAWGVTERPRTSANKIVALKGDEQIALAVDAVGETIKCNPKRNRKNSVDFVLGTGDAEGNEVSILNIEQLFAAAIHGRERRRRRF